MKNIIYLSIYTEHEWTLLLLIWIPEKIPKPKDSHHIMYNNNKNKSWIHHYCFFVPGKFVIQYWNSLCIEQYMKGRGGLVWLGFSKESLRKKENSPKISGASSFIPVLSIQWFFFSVWYLHLIQTNILFCYLLLVSVFCLLVCLSLWGWVFCSINNSSVRFLCVYVQYVQYVQWLVWIILREEFWSEKKLVVCLFVWWLSGSVFFSFGCWLFMFSPHHPDISKLQSPTQTIIIGFLFCGFFLSPHWLIDWWAKKIGKKVWYPIHHNHVNKMFEEWNEKMNEFLRYHLHYSNENL